MKRFLLFDAQCGTCSQIAKVVRQNSNEWLEIRSLHDDKIRAILDSRVPNWRWEPMLLEVDEQQKVHIYTGIALSLQLLSGLGLCRAFKIAQAAAKINKRPVSENPSNPLRRSFFRQSVTSLLGFVIFLHAPKFGRQQSTKYQRSHTKPFNNSKAMKPLKDVEIYSGFLLLPENTKISTDQGLSREINLHGAGAHAGKLIQHKDVKELKERVPFPVYVPTVLPSDYQLVEASTVEYKWTGELWGTRISYGSLDESTGQLIPRISIQSRLHTDMLYPIWPIHSPTVSEHAVVYPEKVSFAKLPPSILLPSAEGHVVQWMHEDIHYMLAVEHDRSREAADQIAQSLVEI